MLRILTSEPFFSGYRVEKERASNKFTIYFTPRRTKLCEELSTRFYEIRNPIPLGVSGDSPSSCDFGLKIMHPMLFKGEVIRFLALTIVV
jgi:hypothetical protein